MSETKVTLNAGLTPHIVEVPWQCNDDVERPLTIEARLLYDEVELSRDLIVYSVKGHGSSEFLTEAKQFVMPLYMSPQLNEGTDYIHDTLRNIAEDIGKAAGHEEWASIYPDLWVKVVELS